MTTCLKSLDVRRMQLFLSDNFGIGDVAASTSYGLWGVLLVLWGVVLGPVIDYLGAPPTLGLARIVVRNCGPCPSCSAQRSMPRFAPPRRDAVKLTPLARFSRRPALPHHLLHARGREPADDGDDKEPWRALLASLHGPARRRRARRARHDDRHQAPQHSGQPRCAQPLVCVGASTPAYTCLMLANASRRKV